MAQTLRMLTMLNRLRALLCPEEQATPPQDVEPTGTLPVPAPERVQGVGEVASDGTRIAPFGEKDTRSVFVYDYPNTTKDGRFVPVSWGLPDAPPPVQRAIEQKDIAELADTWSVNPCHLRAVLAVESAGSGFLLREPAPARPKILFEAHWFYRLTRQPVSQVRSDLSSPRWDRSLYKGGSEEWDRLKDAMEFDSLQALKSASWGLGQVMGFNYTAAGCDSIKQFVVQNFTGEKQQFNHMLNFIDNNGLMGHLRAGRWASFAKGYNGAGYRANRYDEKLAAAAKRCR